MLGLITRQVHGLVTGIECRCEEAVHADDYSPMFKHGMSSQRGDRPPAPRKLDRRHVLPRSIIGKYKILSTIGSGGFGTVYLAVDTWIDKKVALKVPHRRGSTSASCCANLGFSPRQPSERRHDHDGGEAGERLLHRDGVRAGETLEAMIARADRSIVRGARLHVPDRQRARSCPPPRCAASRSAAVERARLGPRLVKVADFGTSRFLEIAAHGTTVIGSPPYMAPEQFQGKALFASDIYSLGVTMFQMLTGDLPYDTPTAADINRLLRGELLVSVRARNPKVPRSDQRDRVEGDGARSARPVSAGRRGARRHPVGPERSPCASRRQSRRACRRTRR